MKDENGIYIDQPILRQIGDLGEKYDAWVHTPLSGQARFFKNQILEDLTRCPWYVIPLVWIPVFLVCCYWSLMVCMVPWWTYLNYWCMGIVGWQVVEYLVHRFIFHSVPTYKPLIVLHFLFHGNHHKFPMDKSRLVFPPLPASWFGIALYALAATFLPAGKTHAYFSGMIIGYIAYNPELKHLSTESKKSNSDLLSSGE
eukprot:TRINITY_DN2951_c0_g1_i15.p3 TRINITY_DN2951_c0_g1~~TRINITY_DN2951_c0_g1_i15.p3  ORF type:complete len:199 (+),score=23.30 TRINITY_DN2951_c0_g1_i15:176-772(+)